MRGRCAWDRGQGLERALAGLLAVLGFRLLPCWFCSPGSLSITNEFKGAVISGTKVEEILRTERWVCATCFGRMQESTQGRLSQRVVRPKRAQ